MTWDYRQAVDPLVERNQFKDQDADRIKTPPEFDVAVSSLPAITLPQRPEWERLYQYSWQQVWDRLRPPPAGGLNAPVMPPSRFSGQDVETTSFIARLAGYSRRAFDLIHLLDNFYSLQELSGFISRELSPETAKPCFSAYEPCGTGPALFAWTEWRRYRLTADEQRLRQAFWPMIAYHRWCRRNRTWPNGLYWATGYSSGLVNQPRVPDGRFHHQHWSWVDASLQAVLDAQLIGRMATLLSEPALAQELSTEHTQLIDVINAKLWNPELSFYQDIGPTGQFSRDRSIAAYWALLDPAIVPKERLSQFLQPLRDTEAFRTPFRVPSLSADSSGYEGPAGNGWRGAVWPHLNYMLTRGLRAVGQPALAYEIAAGLLEQISASYAENDVLWASYAPEMPGPGDPAEVDRSALTAAAVVLIILETIIGISVDWPLRQVNWHRFHNDDGAYGVRNFPLGEQATLDLTGDRERIYVRCDEPLTLVIRDANQTLQVALAAGRNEIALETD